MASSAHVSVAADRRNLRLLFRRGFIATLSLDFVARMLGALAVVILIRGLTVADYAFLTIFLALAQFGGSSAAGGVRTRYLREEAERISRGEDAPAGAFTAALAASLAVTSGLALCALPIALLVGFGRSAGGDVPLLLLYAFGYAAAWGVIELSIARLQARRRFLRAGFLSVARAAAVAVAATIVAIASTSLASLALWFIGLLAAVAVVAAAPGLRESGIHLSNVRRVIGLTREERWLSIYYLAAAGFAYVDVLVASAVLHVEQVATLGAALRYLALVLGVMPALGAILRVRTSQADIVDSSVEQRAMIVNWIRRSAVPAAVTFSIGVGLAPVVIPHIDGGRYPGSVALLQVYLAAGFVIYILAPIPSILMAQRRYAWLATIYTAALVVNLLGDVAAGKQFGNMGIAVVSSTTYVVLGIVMTVGTLRGINAERALQPT